VRIFQLSIVLRLAARDPSLETPDLSRETLGQAQLFELAIVLDEREVLNGAILVGCSHRMIRSQ
jgi:hypothetical protein